MSAVVVPLREPDVELALVGSFFSMPAQAYAAYGDEVNPEWFTDPLLAEMFLSGLREHQARRVVTAKSVVAGIPEISADMTRGQLFAAACAEGMPIAHIPSLMATIKERWARRLIVDHADFLRANARVLSVSPYDLVANTADKFNEIGAVETERLAGSLDEAGDKLTSSLYNPETLIGATTGLHALNQKLNGYRRGMLYVIAGRPGMGKSAFMCSSLRRTAEAGHGVVIFSLEMGQEEIAARMFSDVLDSPFAPSFGDIQSGRISASQRAEIKAAQDSLAGLPVHIESSPRLTVFEIAARARKAKLALEGLGKRLDVLCVDHMGLVTPSGRYAGNKVMETGEVSNALRSLAKELDCCVIMLSQLSRQVESRDDKRPVMSDLRWAGEIEQDAHVVAFLYRPYYYLSQQDGVDPNDLGAARDKLEFLVRKNRNGETCDIDLYCRIQHSAVRGHI